LTTKYFAEKEKNQPLVST